MDQDPVRRLGVDELEALFAALPTPYVVLDLDPDFTIVAANTAFLATTGRTSEELRGRRHSVPWRRRGVTVGRRCLQGRSGYTAGSAPRAVP